MNAPFADIEARINDAVVSALSNRSIIINGAFVAGLFSNEFITVDFVESRKPVFTCKSADISDIAKNDVIETVGDGTLYKVVGIQPNGCGMTKLILELQ